ncbi:hypothetical protein ABBQ38_005515 [Trebouxia sp. C0009 RCD-2024]
MDRSFSEHPVFFLARQMPCIQEGVIADYRDNAEMELPRLMYSYELKRVRYLLQAYLRTRLKKIERFVLHILENEQVLQKLSEKEQTYAQEYFMLYGRHQKETILNQMPDGFKDIAKQSAGSVRGDMIPVPDLDKHVFCRVLADRGYVEMNNAGTETAEFSKDDLYVARYDPIHALLKEGWVHLV